MSGIFTNSLNQIDSILAKTSSFQTQRRTEMFNKGNTEITTLNESLNLPIKYESKKTLIDYDKNFVIENFGHNDYSFSDICIGTHPDFKDLNHTNYLMHHCVSMFVDIKGSTKLIDKYTIQEVRLIKDTILSLVISVANQFGGHIQRLQGDGVFISFVRRKKEPINSIINALNTASILSQFISVDLAEIFSKNEIRPLRIRVGIDYGDDEKVLWSYYGLEGCDELTTTSLHTDMAAKLQAKAFDNSILIGNNIVEALDLQREIISNYYNKETREEVYQITPTLTYKFYIFEWKRYLQKHPNFKLLSTDKLKYEKKNVYLKCEYKINNKTHPYFPNAKGIPKESEIIFTLFENDKQYVKTSLEKIKWTIYNTGNEARLDNCVSFEVDRSSNDMITCTATAKYLGLHKIQCKISRLNYEFEVEFPVIVY